LVPGRNRIKSGVEFGCYPKGCIQFGSGQGVEQSACWSHEEETLHPSFLMGPIVDRTPRGISRWGFDSSGPRRVSALGGYDVVLFESIEGQIIDLSYNIIFLFSNSHASLGSQMKLK